MTRRTVLEYGGLDILVASAGLATSAPDHRDDARRLGAQLRRARPGYFLAAREAFRVLSSRDAAARSCSWPRRTRSSPARTPPPTRRPRPRRCTWRAAWPRKAERTGSASTPSTPTPSSGSSIWSSDWKAERATTYGVDRGRPAGVLPRAARGSGSTCYPEDVAEAIALFAGPRSAKSTGNILNVDGGVTAAYPR